jgi:hypothetical protein
MGKNYGDGTILELAGMTDERGHFGGFPFQADRLYVPADLRLDGDKLRYQPESVADVDDPAGMLKAFVRVQSPAGVLTFARRYGVLGICAHEAPASHNPPPFPLPSSGRVTWCYPRGWIGDVSPYDPIFTWLNFAEKTRAILRCAAALHQRELPQQRDWDALWSGRRRMLEATEEDVRFGMYAIGEAVSEWLRLGAARLTFRWSDDDPELTIAGGTFSTIALQLASTVARRHQTAVCDGCQRIYFVHRKPQAGRRHWCETCRDTVGNRERQQRLQDNRRKRKESGDG